MDADPIINGTDVALRAKRQSCNKCTLSRRGFKNPGHRSHSYSVLYSGSSAITGRAWGQGHIYKNHPIVYCKRQIKMAEFVQGFEKTSHWYKAEGEDLRPLCWDWRLDTGHWRWLEEDLVPQDRIMDWNSERE